MSSPSKPALLGLLVVLAVITFLDRLAIAAAGPRIQQDLGIPPEQWGWVLGAFVLAYGAFEIPTGWWGDRHGHGRVITRIVLWWSAFTALTGMASGFAPLVATRFLFGAGEAGAYPNMAGVVSRFFAPGERAAAQGFIWSASRAGGALSPLIVVPMQAEIGWRASFLVLGTAGLVWCAAWSWLRRGETAAAAASRPPTPWGSILRSPGVRTITAMYGCYAWGSWFYFSWLHTWLVKGRGFTEREMSVFAALPFAMGAAGSLAGGFVGDAMVRRFGVRRGRVLVGSVCLAAGALLLAATASTRDRGVAVVLLTLGFGVMDLMLPSAWAICIDVSGPHAGAVTGVMNTAGQLGGFLCTVIFGYAVARTGNYDLPLYLIAAMVGLAAYLFTRIDASQPLFPQAEEARA